MPTIVEEPEPEPVTPLTLIRDAYCHGSQGKIGADVAANIIGVLEAAGFVIVKADSEAKPSSE